MKHNKSNSEGKIRAPEIEPYKYAQLLLDKVRKATHWKKITFEHTVLKQLNI
jgi:hypothetical protein